MPVEQPRRKRDNHGPLNQRLNILPKPLPGTNALFRDAFCGGAKVGEHLINIFGARCGRLYSFKGAFMSFWNLSFDFENEKSVVVYPFSVYAALQRAFDYNFCSRAISL